MWGTVRKGSDGTVIMDITPDLGILAAVICWRVYVRDYSRTAEVDQEWPGTGTRLR